MFTIILSIMLIQISSNPKKKVRAASTCLTAEASLEASPKLVQVKQKICCPMSSPAQLISVITGDVTHVSKFSAKMICTLALE